MPDVDRRAPTLPAKAPQGIPCNLRGSPGCIHKLHSLVQKTTPPGTEFALNPCCIYATFLPEPFQMKKNARFPQDHRSPWPLLPPLAPPAPRPRRSSSSWTGGFEGPAALFLVPAAKGYFKDAKLDVTIDAGNGSGGTVTRVASGTYDMGFADLAALMEFHANNPTPPTSRWR